MPVVATLAIEFEHEAEVIAFCETLKSDKRRVRAAEIRLSPQFTGELRGRIVEVADGVQHARLYAGLTKAESLNTAETVAGETPAAFATSLMVAIAGNATEIRRPFRRPCRRRATLRTRLLAKIVNSP
jgi:hypothetical protein